MKSSADNYDRRKKEVADIIGEDWEENEDEDDD